MYRMQRSRGAASQLVLFTIPLVALVAVALAPSIPNQDQKKDKQGETTVAKAAPVDKKFLEQDHPGPEATKVGMEACGDCHGKQVAKFSASKHAVYLRKVVAEKGEVCEYCHGPASEHVDERANVKILHFPQRSAYTVKRTTELCVSCHTAVLDKPHWQGNTHAMADVSCVDCHSFHQDDTQPYLLRKPDIKVTNNVAFRYDEKHPTTNQAINGACLNCHREQQSQLRMRSHHPLFEDRVNCADCHEPHKSTDPMLLAENRDLSETCLKCHTNKRGPFVFEHEPARVGGLGDSCLTCHRPHGSPNPKLTVAFGRGLCIQCHTDINQDAAHLNRPGSCWRSGCHSDIHGSNTSPLFFH